MRNCFIVKMVFPAISIPFQSLPLTPSRYFCYLIALIATISNSLFVIILHFRDRIRACFRTHRFNIDIRVLAQLYWYQILSTPMKPSTEIIWGDFESLKSDIFGVNYEWFWFAFVYRLYFKCGNFLRSFVRIDYPFENRR